MSAFDQYYLAIVVVVGTSGAVICLLWVSQRSRYATIIKSFRGIAQNFLTVINVLFALNLAFLANDTWSAHDRALNTAFQEAGSLRNIIDLADPLPPEARSRVVEAVKQYAHLTVSTEWPLLARRRSSQTVSDQLDSLFAAISNHQAVQVESAVRSLMLQQAMEIRRLREVRLALSQTHVNPLKWMGMAFLGFLTMTSIAMVHVDAPRAQALSVILFATAAAPSAAIILIHGNPFQEPMSVSSRPIAAALSGLPTGDR